MSKATKVPFVVTILGLMILAAVLFVTTQLVFRDQPGVQNIFSIIWTVALAILIYRLLLNGRSANDPAHAANLYALIRLMIELLAVVTLLFTAIMATLVLTSPGSSIQLVMTIGITGLMALLLLIIPRALRVLNRRDQLAKEQQEI